MNDEHPWDARVCVACGRTQREHDSLNQHWERRGDRWVEEACAIEAVLAPSPDECRNKYHPYHECNHTPERSSVPDPLSGPKEQEG
jgi:hypothetical protein